jgi:hypothetical protein
VRLDLPGGGGYGSAEIITAEADPEPVGSD